MPWARTWHLLAQPSAAEVRAKLREEITQTIGDRLPTLEEVSKLVYTRAVFSESMRIFHPPGWLVGGPSGPVTIGGVEVPERTIVICSTMLVHRSPNYWEDPLVFNPDRWLQKEAPERPKCAYFPFGAGARVCMGEAFAGQKESSCWPAWRDAGTSTIAAHRHTSHLRHLADPKRNANAGAELTEKHFRNLLRTPA